MHGKAGPTALSASSTAISLMFGEGCGACVCRIEDDAFRGDGMGGCSFSRAPKRRSDFWSGGEEADALQWLVEVSPLRCALAIRVTLVKSHVFGHRSADRAEG